MPAIMVESIAYYVPDVRQRRFPNRIGSREVPFHIRSCNGDAIDPVRVIITTSNAKQLPSPKRIGNYHIYTKGFRRGKNSIIVKALGPHTLPDVSYVPSPADAQLWPSIVILLDQLLPEYLFE